MKMNFSTILFIKVLSFILEILANFFIVLKIRDEPMMGRMTTTQWEKSPQFEIKNLKGTSYASLVGVISIKISNLKRYVIFARFFFIT